MSDPLTPLVALGIISYGNNWYNTRNVADVKPLLFAGIAGILLEGLAAVPGMDKTATALGWLAFIGFVLSPVQKPSPVQNLLSISGGNSK
jgi:hypothetical protein